MLLIYVNYFCNFATKQFKLLVSSKKEVFIMYTVVKVVIWLSFITNFIGYIFWYSIIQRNYPKQISNLGKNNDLNLERYLSHSHDLIAILLLISIVALTLIYKLESNAKKLDEIKKILERN